MCSLSHKWSMSLVTVTSVDRWSFTEVLFITQVAHGQAYAEAQAITIHNINEQ